jgi:hypothetical protein
VLPLTLSAKAMASSPFGVFAFSTSDDRTRSADAQARGAIERRYPIGSHEAGRTPLRLKTELQWRCRYYFAAERGRTGYLLG